MKSIRTQITINAPAAQVWKVLTNFSDYPNWNPFIKSISGEPAVGGSLNASIQLPGQNPMTFKPTVLKAEEGREFRWLGKTFFNGLFDGEHYFILKPINDQETEFIHGEQFTGLLAGAIFKMIGENTKKGFEAMNQALKEKAEQL